MMVIALALSSVTFLASPKTYIFKIEELTVLISKKD
jgi:hypothetical protein